VTDADLESQVVRIASRSESHTAAGYSKLSPLSLLPLDASSIDLSAYRIHPSVYSVQQNAMLAHELAHLAARDPAWTAWSTFAVPVVVASFSLVVASQTSDRHRTIR